jgi:hypothetical protein
MRWLVSLIATMVVVAGFVAPQAAAGVTPIGNLGDTPRVEFRDIYADAYEPKNTDAPDALQYALQNAPPGTTVNGAVYWQVYRALVTNVVLLNPQTGTHLAQWNIWQPGAPLP